MKISRLILLMSFIVLFALPALNAGWGFDENAFSLPGMSIGQRNEGPLGLDREVPSSTPASVTQAPASVTPTKKNVLDGFKNALHALQVNLNTLATTPAAERIQKLITLQDANNQSSIPSIRLQLNNLVGQAPTQLKGSLSDSLMSGLASLTTKLSQALAAVSLSAHDIAALQADPNSPAHTALNNAINALAQFVAPAAALEKAFDGLIDAYNKSLPKLDPTPCLNLLV